MTTITEYQVCKTDLNETRLVEREVTSLGDGEIIAKVDRFAFTANNITYGVVGERIGYWKFFPVEDKAWGIIPVWGFADVIESRHDEINVGERLYGYWPMGSHLIMAPGKVQPTRLLDAATHRQELPPVYNSYQRVTFEQGYDGDMDDERMVLFPLYATSFCLYDFLLDNDWFGAQQVIIPSASSKTAIGTAYAITEDASRPALVGLTSERNKAAVAALSLYDTVLTYDAINEVDAKTPTVIVDMSGNGDVLGALHKHLGDNMKYTTNVGVTHFDANKMGPDFISERSAMFFAPGHIQKRTKDWGPGEFEKRAGLFWHQASLKSRNWLAIKTASGPEAIDAAYRDVLNAKTPANAAWVVGF
ncbi:MAG: hypothetical protein DHS20C05_00920 [Hyphococcus sp.]|nr:MAG: hypothetical protein DHS20C05_00920 [Marinicaulis sp.]